MIDNNAKTQGRKTKQNNENSRNTLSTQKGNKTVTMTIQINKGQQPAKQIRTDT